MEKEIIRLLDAAGRSCRKGTDMDYKDLIAEIRESNVDGDGKIELWATTIEHLLAERNTAIEELRGICWCCAHGRKWENAPCWSNMITCEHLKEIRVLARSGGKSKCPHWEWRGTRKEGGS